MPYPRGATITQPPPPMDEYLREVSDHAQALNTALDQCLELLRNRDPGLGRQLSKVIMLYPKCIEDRKRLKDPHYDVEARHSQEFRRQLIHARVILRDVTIRYSYIVSCDFQSLSLSLLTSQRGIPAELVFSLQLKACMMKYGKKSRGELRARDAALMMLEDITDAVDVLDPAVRCVDLPQKLAALAEAISRETKWPEPYAGRELDAERLLHIANSVISSASLRPLEASTPKRLGAVRRLVDDFLGYDAQQITPLVPLPHGVARMSFASPASTINSFTSTSTTIRPTPAAERYFSTRHLMADLEVDRIPRNRGGFARIHPAVWMNMDVAVKIIGNVPEDPSTTRQVNREQSIWGQVYNEHILPLFGVADWDGGQEVLVSPWVANNNAREYFREQSTKRNRVLKPNTSLTDACVKERLKFALYIASGMYYLHKKGIVHGDIRLGNILVSNEGEPLITDFGLSKSTLNSFDVAPSTTFERSGTTRWMAPELFQDSLPSRTKQSDVWAFACAVLELFTECQPYFDIKLDQKVILNLMTARGRPNVPSDLQKQIPRLWKILEGCWSHDPEQRPSMGGLVMSLMVLYTGRFDIYDAVLSG